MSKKRMRCHSARPHIALAALVEAAGDLPEATSRDYPVGAHQSSPWVAADEGRAGVEMMMLITIHINQYIGHDVLLGRSVMRVGQTYLWLPTL
jgi:hypothetical protein